MPLIGWCPSCKEWCHVEAVTCRKAIGYTLCRTWIFTLDRDAAKAAYALGGPEAVNAMCSAQATTGM